MIAEIAPIGAVVVSATVAYLGYRRSRHVDRATVEATTATGRVSEVSLVVAGLNQLVDQLQEELRRVDGVNKRLRADLDGVNERLHAVSADCDVLKVELRRLQRKYGNSENTDPPRNKET